MGVSAKRAVQLVTELETELLKRRQPIEKRDKMYRGEQPLAYASPQFRQHHAGRYEGFSDNWCGVVGDAPIERLEAIGIKPRGEDGQDVVAKADTDLWRVWTENEADFYSDLSFLDAGVTSRAFALVWGNPDDEQTPRVTWEHPSQAIVTYDPETGRRRAGLKLWADDTLEFSTLYLPDQIWKFQRRRVATAGGKLWTPSSTVAWPGGWEARQPETDEVWPLPNPIGEVPLVELENRPRTLGEPISDISGVISMQNAINLLWAYLFNTADFASFPQRVVLGAERPMVPVLDEHGQTIGEREVDLEQFAVKRVFWVEDENAKIDQWDAASLDLFTKVMEVQVAHIAAQTRTPQHYLIGKIANLSGDALKAAETGLVKKAEEKTKHYGRGLREIFRLIALAQSKPKLAGRIGGGQVLWADVESRSRAQTADELLKMRQIGFPFEFLAQRYGLTPTEVTDVVVMRQRELREASLVDIDAIFGSEGADVPDHDAAAA